MYDRQHKPTRKSANSSNTPANQLTTPSFIVQPKVEPADSPANTKPDLQSISSQLLTNISIFPPGHQPPPPPTVQTQLIQHQPGSTLQPEINQQNLYHHENINFPVRETPIQLAREAGMTATPDIEGSIQKAQGRGQPLADSIKQPMERAFGADFSRVNIHTDAQADQLNQSIQAKAFTTGQDIFFRQGNYNPANRGGQELLAHELTHVIQQNGSGLSRRAIQRQPEADPKHPGFYQDDKKPKLKLKLIKKIEEDKKSHFQIRNQLQPLYWKEETPDTYYKDDGFSETFPLDDFLTTYQFGGWLETYQETLAEHTRIDEDKSIEPAEKERRKNAISMYLLQQYITNALFRAEEIERMDYQSSPLNYQDKSQYLRSFATSYVKALQDKLPAKYPASKLYLTRTDNFADVLDKFFEVLKVSGIGDVSQVQTGLSKTITKAAEYLYYNDKDLNEYWSVPGNPQAFVDITPMLEKITTSTEHQKTTENIGNLVKKALVEGIAEQLAKIEIKKKYSSVPQEEQEKLQQEIANSLKVEIPNAEIDAEIEVFQGKSKKKDELLKLVSDNDKKGYYQWLKSLKAKKTTHQKNFISATEAIEKNSEDTVAKELQNKSFQELIKNDYTKYLESKKKTFRQEDFTAGGGKGWDSYNQLKDKIKRAFSTANMVVTTGGMITFEKTDKFEQSGILVDDSKMEMAVKTAINKSGNVPTPTVASRKLLKDATLKEIVTEVIEKQRDKASKETRDKLQKVKDKITKFDPKTYTSLVQVEDQLKETQEALKKFKTEYTKDVEYVKVEAEAAIKLLEASGALSDDSPLPAFVLRQLQQHLQDAIASQDKIEDFVRNIQGIHEAVILALELNNQEYDKDYNYHAPQYKEGTSDKDQFFQGAHLTDYGLKAFSQAYDAVAAQVKANGSDKLDIEAFYNIYFELRDKLDSTTSSSKDKVRLQTPSSVDEYLKSIRCRQIAWTQKAVDVIMIDIHPNDATKMKIARNEVISLMKDLFGKIYQRPDGKDFRLTIMIDITLNHTSEPEVAAIREAAQPYIKAGNLNLVFVQSLTKFAQLGMDKQSGGLVFAYNDPKKWAKFNETLQSAKQQDEVDPTIQKYFQALFKHTKDEQVKYIEDVRANTKQLHKMLVETFKKLDIKQNAIQIAENTDQGTCYVALRYDEFVAKIYPFAKTKSFDEIHHFNVDILENGINQILRQTGLPVAMRFSFGFPVSNLGETGKEVRFTIGLEGREQLQDYVDVLAYINGKFAKEYEALASSKNFDKLTKDTQRKQLLVEITKDIQSLTDLREKLKDLLKKEGI
ncbi:hypothetical protein CLI64_13405 [Nostoc sp. CENA543]|uniref:eCIS core domain-containing protein n=1 Tax=Nostoc sp. CENA543 TaxID=1869241 RepID=UPI000CA38897|nr:DUF4157 domain-containing protein [Nostoc sp. CENA543]AUT01317.1 hypothetical protein CLI64_13405 [Nostoc sp. CENA543]